MYMFSEQMKYSSGMVEKLLCMNKFLALFYSAAWLKADRGADAPINDLQLIHGMIDFRVVDQEVADAVIDKLANHRWYLTQKVAEKSP